jgi:hypothetical protein
MTATVTIRELEEPSDTTNWSARVMYNADTRERLGWLNSTDADGEVSMGQYQRYSQNATQEYNRYHHPESDAFESRVQSIRDDLDPDTESLTVNGTSQTYTYPPPDGLKHQELSMTTPTGTFRIRVAHCT